MPSLAGDAPAPIEWLPLPPEVVSSIFTALFMLALHLLLQVFRAQPPLAPNSRAPPHEAPSRATSAPGEAAPSQPGQPFVDPDEPDCVKYTQCFINNQWVPACSGKSFETLNPVTEQVICTVAQGDKADVDKVCRGTAPRDWLCRRSRPLQKHSSSGVSGGPWTLQSAGCTSTGSQI